MQTLCHCAFSEFLRVALAPWLAVVLNGWRDFNQLREMMSARDNGFATIWNSRTALLQFNRHREKETDHAIDSGWPSGMDLGTHRRPLKWSVVPAPRENQTLYEL